MTFSRRRVPDPDQSSNFLSQATSALEAFKMESPVKKVQFSEADKENREAQYASDQVAVPVKGIPDDLPEPIAKKVEAETIKEDDEEVEPLLAENPQRFVLFPIKYHEVGQQ